jgi:hypothetical protein
MKKIKMPHIRSLAAVLVALALLGLSSCHGHGDHYYPVTVQPYVFPLQVGVPVRDIVPLGGFNAYAVSVHAGSTYKISMTAPTDDVDLLYFGADGTYTFLASCAIDNTALIGVTAEDCVVTAPGNVLYLGADGTYLWYGSASYTIDVEELTVTGLGASIPGRDAKNVKAAGLYSVPVTTGGRYTVAVTGLTDDASLYVFANSDLSSQTACAVDNTLYTGTTPEDCTLVADSGTLSLIVDPIFSSTPNVGFTVFAAPAPMIAVPADEGSSSVSISLSIDSPAIGQVGFNGTSFYSAPVTTVGSPYTVSLTGLTNNANLTVYNNDSTFTTPATCSPDNTFFSGTIAEDCTVTASGSTLYFTITADTGSGGVAYLTLVSPGP